MAAAGIRVTVEFPTPEGCPIATLSARGNTRIRQLTTSIAADDRPSVSEFLIAADAVPEDYEHDPVFTYTDQHCYRVPHGADGGCPCRCLGEYDTPVERFVANAGTLRLVFHARDFETLQHVIGELRKRFPDVDIQQLIRAPTEGAPRDTVFVDRSRLTDRQLEVLEVSYEGGYFDRPRGANATELADQLDITASTFMEHLHAAQRKLLGDILERDD